MKNNLSQVEIAFSVSEEYVHLLSVALISMIENSNPDRRYNVTILNRSNISVIRKHLDFLKMWCKMKSLRVGCWKSDLL